MLWILLLAVQLMLGFCIAGYFLRRMFNVLTLLAIAVPVGIGISSMLYFLLIWLLGNNRLHLVLHCIICALISATTFKYKKKQAICLHDLLSAGAYFTLSVILITTSYFRNGAIPETIIPYFYEELAISSSFAFGANSGRIRITSMKHSAQFREELNTKWLTAFHSAMLQRVASMEWAFRGPSILYFTAFCILMSNLALEFGIPRGVAFIAPFLPMFIAGYAFCDIRHEPKGIRNIDYVSRTRISETMFLHPMLHFYLGNRGTQLAASTCCAVVLVLCRLVRSRKKEDCSKEAKFVGFLTSVLLPSIQMQSFLAVSIFVFLLLLFNIRQHKDNGKAFLLGYLMGSVPHVKSIFVALKQLHVVKYWQKYVSQGRFFPFLSFWFEYYGAFPFLVLTLTWFMIEKREYRVFVPCVLTWVVLSNISSHKTLGLGLLTLQYGFLPIASVFYLASICRISSLKKIPDEVRGALSALAIFATAMNCLSGVAGYFVQLKETRPVWDQDDITLANWIKKNTPAKAVFASSFGDLPAETVLAGRTSFAPPKLAFPALDFNSSANLAEINMFCIYSSDDEYLKDANYFVRYNHDKKSECRYVVLDETKWRKVFTTDKVTIYARFVMT